MNLAKVCPLYRLKASGFVAHNGLELELIDGARQVFHNSPLTGPTICSYDDFAEGQSVTRKSEVTAQLDEVAHRIFSLLEQKRSYKVTNFNCEHAVNWVLNGVKKSPQVKATAAGAAVGAGIAWLLGGSTKQIAVAAGVGAGAGLLTSKAQQLQAEKLDFDRVY